MFFHPLENLLQLVVLSKGSENFRGCSAEELRLAEYTQLWGILFIFHPGFAIRCPSKWMRHLFGVYVEDYHSWKQGHKTIFRLDGHLLVTVKADASKAGLNSNAPMS